MYASDTESDDEAYQVEDGAKKALYEKVVATKVPGSSRIAVLPEGWEEVVDEESGYPFFFNASTGESKWELPGVKAGLSLDISGFKSKVKDPHEIAKLRRLFAKLNKPEWSFEFDHDRHCLVYTNDITQVVYENIPPIIDRLHGMESLTRLNVSSNGLVDLPSLGKCRKLIDLKICFNKIRNLPDTFRHLERLEVLDATATESRTLPTSWTEWENFMYFS